MKITLLLLLTLLFIACGSSSNGEHSSFRISNISPLIDINETYLIEENTREAFQVKATDNTSLKYYISGEDAYLLYIDTITGELFFNEPTNYKKKSTYSFILIVEDSVGNRTIKDITIKIKEGEKAPPTPIGDNKKRAFITLWKINHNDKEITIPTIGDGYNYQVDWGDDTTNRDLTGNATHSYAYAGTYLIKITGQFPRIYFENSLEKDKILSVQQWGDNEWKSMGGAFSGCVYMIVSAIDKPNLSKVTDMYKMFASCENFNQDIGHWDVSHVSNMSRMFIMTNFNQDIGSWDVSHVTNMSYMFALNDKFNQNINAWDTSHVTNMDTMFSSTRNFNQDLSNWDTSSVINMEHLFSNARNFNQNINSWDTSSVTSMSNMFASAISFNQNIGSWNVSSVTNMKDMFRTATAFTHQNLSQWDVSNVTPDAHSNFFTASGENNIEPLWRE